MCHEKGQPKEHFYVRNGNASKELLVAEMRNCFKVCFGWQGIKIGVPLAEIQTKSVVRRSHRYLASSDSSRTRVVGKNLFSDNCFSTYSLVQHRHRTITKPGIGGLFLLAKNWLGHPDALG